jgi:hypothetical protein
MMDQSRRPGNWNSTIINHTIGWEQTVERSSFLAWDTRRCHSRRFTRTGGKIGPSYAFCPLSLHHWGKMSSIWWCLGNIIAVMESCFVLGFRGVGYYRLGSFVLNNRVIAELTPCKVRRYNLKMLPPIQTLANQGMYTLALEPLV